MVSSLITDLVEDSVQSLVEVHYDIKNKISWLKRTK